MTSLPEQDLPAGHALFARYAFPPNELGYCGPAETGMLHGGGPPQLASFAQEFDGAWPYLRAIADAVGSTDPLDAEVVRSYWVGGPPLDKVDSTELLARLRKAFTGQVTGLLGDLPATAQALAHHSFHVFVVYPWVGFLDRDPTTPLRVMQDCRIRWGTVESVDAQHAVIPGATVTALNLGDHVAPVDVRGRRPCARRSPGRACAVEQRWRIAGAGTGAR